MKYDEKFYKTVWIAAKQSGKKITGKEVYMAFDIVPSVSAGVNIVKRMNRAINGYAPYSERNRKETYNRIQSALKSIGLEITPFMKYSDQMGVKTAPGGEEGIITEVRRMYHYMEPMSNEITQAVRDSAKKMSEGYPETVQEADGETYVSFPDLGPLTEKFNCRCVAHPLLSKIESGAKSKDPHLHADNINSFKSARMSDVIIEDGAGYRSIKIYTAGDLMIAKLRVDEFAVVRIDLEAKTVYWYE